MYSWTWGGGGGGICCLHFTGMNVFGSFSLWEPKCMHCVYLALWMCKALCGGFYAPYIYIYELSFMHSKMNDMLMYLVASVFCWSILNVMIYSSEWCVDVFSSIKY